MALKHRVRKLEGDGRQNYYVLLVYGGIDKERVKKEFYEKCDIEESENDFFVFVNPLCGDPPDISKQRWEYKQYR